MSFVHTREHAHMRTLIEKAIEEHLSLTKDYVNTLIEMYTVCASSTGTKVIRHVHRKGPFLACLPMMAIVRMSLKSRQTVSQFDWPNWGRLPIEKSTIERCRNEPFCHTDNHCALLQCDTQRRWQGCLQNLTADTSRTKCVPLRTIAHQWSIDQ